MAAQKITTEEPKMSMCTHDQLERWQQRFRRKSIECDISQITIPEHQPEMNRLIIVPKGLTFEKLVKIMRTCHEVRLFDSKLYATAKTHNNRSNHKATYALWVRERIESDEELKNLSPEDIVDRGIAGVTLLERLLYEWAYHDETGNHLDSNKFTLCTGSHYGDGSVPCVCWDPINEKLCVNPYPKKFPHASFRVREVIA